MAVETDLRFGLLGTLAVERGGASVEIGHTKQRAVLALLLINANRPLTVGQMADALWGDRPPQSAAATLQAYVSNLRRALEPDRPPRTPATVLLTTAGGYQLDVDPDAVDSLRFAALVAGASGRVEPSPVRARAMLVEALGLWRGPALADFRYEEFARTEAERLEDLRATALELRIAADLALGASDELIPELEGLVREYPLRERLRGHQMLALYRAGRQTEALAAYRDLVEILREELGLDPGLALRELQLAILEHDPRLAPASGAGGAIVVGGAQQPAPQLVGRIDERRQLDAALDRAGGGRGSVVIVQGEPGIGKTRLLELLHHEARSRGLVTAFARCVEVGGTPPFWPWMQLVRQLDPAAVVAAAGEYVAHLAPLLPSGSEASAGYPSPLHRVADGLVAALRGLSSERPVLLILDDLYSSDPDSLSLLTLLSASIGDLPVVIVGSHRGQDLGRSHPLTEALSNLMRFDWVERIAMHRFDHPEVAALVGQVTGTVVDDAVIEAIRERTNGNALFAIELTKLLCSRDRLDADSAASLVPGSIREVVGSRVDQLSPDSIRLLRVGSVAGREFALRDVGEVLALDIDAMIDAVEEAVVAGLLQETDRPGTYRFSHMMVVDAVRDSLGSIRKAQIHQSLADSLERTGAGMPDAWIDIAHHRVEAIPIAGPLDAIEALARAGRHALSSDALALADDLFERRRALVDDLPDSPGRPKLQVDALLDLVRVWTVREGYHSARIGTATATLWNLTGLRQGTPATDPTTPITSDDPVLCTLQARFSFEMVRGDSVACEVVVDRYLEFAASTGDPLVEAGANIAANIAWAHAGRVDDGVRAAERAGAAFSVLDPDEADTVMLPLGQQSARVTQHSFAGWAYHLAGDRERSDAELAMSRALCDRLEHGFTTGFCVAVECIVAAMDGDPERVAETVEWGRKGRDDDRFGLFDVWRDLFITWSDGMRCGDPAAAADRMRSSIALLEGEGALVVNTLYWAMTAMLDDRAGRSESMLDAARRGIDLAERCGERFWYPELERLAADAFGRLGRPDERAAALRRASEAAGVLGLRSAVARPVVPSGA